MVCLFFNLLLFVLLNDYLWLAMATMMMVLVAHYAHNSVLVLYVLVKF